MHIKKRLTLLMILLTGILSSITFFLVWYYLDPYAHTSVALILITLSFILGISSFATVAIYFFKKIYYRGEVYLFHVIHSFRQAFFLSLFLFSIIVFIILGAPLFIGGLAVAMLLIFLELFIQDIFH